MLKYLDDNEEENKVKSALSNTQEIDINVINYKIKMGSNEASSNAKKNTILHQIDTYGINKQMPRTYQS
jgi:hypothetical protein